MSAFRRKRYDIVHCQFGRLGRRYSYLRRLWKAPLVVSIRGRDFQPEAWAPGNKMYEHVFRVADAMLPVSESTREELIDLGCRPDKAVVLPDPHQMSDYPFRTRTLMSGEVIRLISVGRLAPDKGFDTSIRSVRRLVDRFPKLQYDIIGEGK